MSKFVFVTGDIVTDDKFVIGDEIKANLNNSEHYSPIFAFNYLLNDTSDFSFNSEYFVKKDIISFFNNVRIISQYKLCQLINGEVKNLHFKFINNPLNTKLKQLLLKTFKEQLNGKDLTPEVLPDIGEFALYTSETLASRSTGVKSPRIFFFLGDKSCTLYLLYFDAFHEIFDNPAISSN